MAKNPHAVALGKLGGKVGGKARSERKTAANRANARKPRPRARKASRYCGMCDAWVRGKECPKCGADTDKGAA